MQNVPLFTVEVVASYLQFVSFREHHNGALLSKDYLAN